MRIGRFEHTPGVVKTVWFLIFLSALLALGTWQMLRAAEKKTILAAAENALSASAVPAFSLTDLAYAAEQHTQVSISGQYDGARQFLWDNRVHKGQAGFEVITPVRTKDGLVLVNRGWVPPGPTREALPDVALSAEALSSKLSFNGLFSRPSKGFIGGDSFDVGEQWPKVLQYFDYAAIEAVLGEPVLAGIVQPQQTEQSQVGTQEENAAASSTLAANTFYTANWEPTAAIGPTRHYGYAFQWYAMALALVVLFIVYNTRRIESVQ